MSQYHPPLPQLFAIEFWVGNPHFAAAFYQSKFDLRYVGFRGLETGERTRISLLLRQQDVLLIFTGSVDPDDEEFHTFLRQHGESVRDISFLVDNAEESFRHCVDHCGSSGLRPPSTLVLEGGTVVQTAQIGVPLGNWRHTLITIEPWGPSVSSRDLAPRIFGFSAELPASFSATIQDCDSTHPSWFDRVDHLAFAVEKGTCSSCLEWYNNAFGFRRYLCDGETAEDGMTIHGSSSSLRTMVCTMTQTAEADSPDFGTKFVFVEPAPGEKKSQIQEFLDYHQGPGVAHMALHCQDIVAVLQLCQKRHVPMIQVPSTYYDIKEREGADHQVLQSWEDLRSHGVLLDFEASLPVSAPSLDGALVKKALGDGDETEGGSPPFAGRPYLLQTFTQPLHGRPTFYLEFISRFGSTGFGKGNIKALFEAIELQQSRRGNL